MISWNDAKKKYGLPSVEREHLFMTRWEIPVELRAGIPALPKAIYLNKDMLSPLAAAFRNLVARGFGDELQTFDGCFAVRTMRGSKSWSLHSWGIAIDFNASENRLGAKPKFSAGFVQCFKDAGFDWGGDWQRKDGMHFQLAHI